MALFSGKSARNSAVFLGNMAGEERAQNNKIIEDYLGNSLSDLGSGIDKALPYYQGAIDRYQPWATQGLAGYNLYGDSLGVNGAEGNARAVGAFQASPGYQWQVDQATDAVARKQSALGMLGSGNTQTAIQDRANQLANQEYSGWQNNLQNLGQMGLQATGQQANLDRGMGDLYAGLGQQQAGLRMGAANTIVGNNTNFMNNLSQLGQKAGQAGQDALANNLNFGVNAAGTAIKALGLFSGTGAK
ncbi:hypothetical protein GCM10019059_37770 [Camelimonas fluminis]|uniref:Uncharacterized protein n=1 Tax=Camelimonas fluminis TaxID=1576911 RepID=A0ABV7UP26_9HYPH|nr:hypothetical protein [Camelimonas fluminis]GHE74686.1 hypothetical protein GCM10019059_37770 [Camelimonas fluminis]